MLSFTKRVAALTLLIPLMAVAAVFVAGRLKKINRSRREGESRIQSHVQQTLAGIQVVQAFGQEEREQERFQRYADEVIRADQRGVVVSNLSGLWSGLVLTIATGTVLLVGGFRVLGHEMTLGALLVFLAYMATLQDRFKRLLGVWTTLQTLGVQLRHEDATRQTVFVVSRLRSVWDAGIADALVEFARNDPTSPSGCRYPIHAW